MTFTLRFTVTEVVVLRHNPFSRFTNTAPAFKAHALEEIDELVRRFNTAGTQGTELAITDERSADESRQFLDVFFNEIDCFEIVDFLFTSL